MSNITYTLKVTSGPWRAVYEGGAYIDVYHRARSYPLDVINVYDYEAGRPHPPFDQFGPDLRGPVRRALREWVREVGDDYLNELPYL